MAESTTMQSECSNECTICLLDYTEKTKKVTECCHTFHRECLDRWLETKPSCPLCRTILVNSAADDRPYYRDMDSFLEARRAYYGPLRAEPYEPTATFIYSRIPVVAEIVSAGYTQEDSILIQPSGSIGITRVGSPFGLNVTYVDGELISQPEEELTQVAMNSLISSGSAVHSSMMQNMGELFDFNALYPNSMTRTALAGEEIISDGYRFPYNEYFNNTIEEVD